MVKVENLEVRLARENEIDAVQALENSRLEDGFKHFRELHHIYFKGILVAVQDGNVLGYIGANRIYSDEMNVGIKSDFRKSMPPWDHDPRQYFASYGGTFYILGHAVKKENEGKEISEVLIKEFLRRTKESGVKEPGNILQVAVIYNLRHPTLINPLKLWGSYGFKPLLNTYDPNWKHSADKPADGGMIWALDFTE